MKKTTKTLLIILTVILSIIGFYFVFSIALGKIYIPRPFGSLVFYASFTLGISPAIWFIKKAEMYRERKKEEYRFLGMKNEDKIDCKARNHYAFKVMFTAFKYIMLLVIVLFIFLFIATTLYRIGRTQ